MKSPHCFIVKPVDGRRYDNIRTYEGKEFIISTSQEDHTVSNRFAEVLARPTYYSGPVRVGDIVIVHHNVFRYYYDMKGRQKSSWHYVMDDVFIVEPQQVYLYMRDGIWNAPSPFCFVRPVESEDHMFTQLGSLEQLWGELVFKNNDIEYVSCGDVVSFTPDSEYEFRIGEEVLYRMYNRNICLKR